jgi:hypothetical protein
LSSLEAVILGGLISLISAVVGILLQHFLSIRKMLHEDKAKAEVEKARQNTGCLTELEQLFQKYSLYLPSELLDKLNLLKSECWLLSSHADLDKTFHAINLLFETQNFVREFVGVDRLSQDLMKALRRKPAKESRKSEK